MARPIRSLSEGRGYSLKNHVCLSILRCTGCISLNFYRSFSTQNLASFGGAGGQHACPLARILGINTVIIHKYSSILSAYGMALADTVSEQSMPASEIWGKEGADERLKVKFQDLVNRARSDLDGQGIKESKVDGDDGMKLVFEKYLFMRYNGSDAQLVVKEPEDGGT